MASRPVTYVMWFDEYRRELAPRLGGKCASLGELTTAGLPVPPGFAITIDGQEAVCGGIADRVQQALAACDPNDGARLAHTTAPSCAVVEICPIPDDLREAYARLAERCGLADVPVAVRSSATCEDSPDASFAGEHDTFLWVCGEEDVLDAVRCCWSSLFTPSAPSPTAVAVVARAGPSTSPRDGPGLMWNVVSGWVDV